MYLLLVRDVSYWITITMSHQKTSAAIFTVLLAVVTQPLSAQDIYKTVDENGNVTYSDSPVKENSKKLDLPEINSQPSPNPETAPRFFKADEKTKPIKYALKINEPIHDQAIPPGQRDVAIIAEIDPIPTEDDITYTLLVDGSATDTAELPSFLIKEPLRGSHDIQIQAKQDKKVIATSKSITIHVIRPTVAN
ncbi:hypothetical protein MAH1_00550 [Sessilibacter sp. MAH1]